MKLPAFLYLTATLGAQAALVAHYPFDGDATDASGGGNDLTAYADDNTNFPSVSASGGQAGGFASFDGQNLFNTTFAPVTGNDSRTFSMFVRTSTDNSGNDGLSTMMFAGWGQTDLSTRRRFDFGLQGGSNSQLRNEYNAGATTSNSSITVVDGQWHHVAVTWESTTDTATFYLDGSAYGTGSVAGLDTGSEVGISIGGDTRAGGSLTGTSSQTPFRFLTGDLDDVRVYDEALDSSQIANLAAVPEPSITLLGAIGFLGLLRRRR